MKTFSPFSNSVNCFVLKFVRLADGSSNKIEIGLGRFTKISKINYLSYCKKCKFSHSRQTIVSRWDSLIYKSTYIYLTKSTICAKQSQQIRFLISNAIYACCCTHLVHCCLSHKCLQNANNRTSVAHYI
jgi:hypothetical protein